MALPLIPKSIQKPHLQDGRSLCTNVSQTSNDVAFTFKSREKYLWFYFLFSNPNKNQTWWDGIPTCAKFILQEIMVPLLLGYVKSSYVINYNSISPLTITRCRIVKQHAFLLASNHGIMWSSHTNLGVISWWWFQHQLLANVIKF